MTPNNFVKTYWEAAILEQERSGYSAIAKLTQAAIESGWGNKAVGFNFFGIKDFDGVNGNEQLLNTTEWLKSKLIKFPKIYSIVYFAEKKLYKYKVADYFRKYDSAFESFKDHSDFILRNKRYAKAYQNRALPYICLDQIAKAGYATDPNYAKLLQDVAKMIEREARKLGYIK